MTDDLFEYQTYLQGLANQLGEDIARLIGSTDRELVELLLREISKLPKDKRKAHQKLQRLEKTIEELRGKGFDKGLEVSYGTVKELIDAAGSVAQKEILAENAKKQERDIRASRIPKSLSDRQVDDILDYTPLDGRTVRQWFARFQRNDTELIMQTIQRGFVEGHTLETIIRSIRGTKEHNFQNGILETSRQSARMLGRTLVNGASNAARLAMFEANKDVIDGVKFLGTFDSRTCLVCATYDGRIWPPDQLNQVVRPPMHPNCRCVLIPHVDHGERYAVGNGNQNQV